MNMPWGELGGLFLLVLLLHFAIAWWIGGVAERRGYSRWAFFAIGAVSGTVSIIIIYLLPNKREDSLLLNPTSVRLSRGEDQPNA